MTEKEYSILCKNHDWHYARSDDRTRYNNGFKESRCLKSLARENPRLKEIYDAWADYKLIGKTNEPEY